MTSANQAIQRTVARAQATPAEASDGCYICQKVLWVSVFFDEPRHDAEKERGTEKLSNIGKLFHSHEPTNPSRGIYRLYYNGLGVQFKEPNIARHKTAGRTISDELKNYPGDQAKDAAKETIKGKGKDVLDDLRNPMKWLGDIVGILAKVGFEYSDTIRDREVVSQVTLSGVMTRVDNAIAKLAEIVKAQKLPVKHINVAVFGSGLGGAMARRFVNELISVCKQRGSLYYPTPNMGNGEATLEIQFLGLLDSVSATIDDNSVVSTVVGKFSLGLATLRVSGPMGIPDQVGRVVHYVAGHELRVTRRVDSVRKGKSVLTKEVVLPGNHEDLVGNYPEVFQARSTQLSRIPVKRLHEDAFSSGVPVMSMQKLEKKDIDLFNLIRITSETQVHPGMPRMPLEHLLKSYKETSGELETQLIEHTRRFISWMNIRYHTPSNRSRPPEAAYELVKTHVKRLHTMVNHPHSTHQLSKEERILLETWNEPLKLDDYQLVLFDDYIHDELYLSPLDLAVADWGNNGYFKIRGIDESNETTSKE